MLGAIAGDVIGSVYEHHSTKTTEFLLFPPGSRFTDDSVLTCAVALAILEGRPYRDCVLELGRRHPDAGYGASFIHWLFERDPKPYGSWGNGSAMRVSPVGFAFDDIDSVLAEAKKSAAISHDHPEGIKGAQAAALAVFLARTGADTDTIRAEIASRFGYELERTIDEIRPGYGFDVSCAGSVPEAIVAALEAASFEQAVRKAVSLGGDADTQAAIAGAIAEARFGVDPGIEAEVRGRLSGDLIEILDRFQARFGAGR